MASDNLSFVRRTLINPGLRRSSGAGNGKFHAGPDIA
jgi:hypothetical protein